MKSNELHVTLLFQTLPNFSPTMPDTIKEFFTDSEWDLIYNLVSNNRQFCEDEEEDPVEDYDNIISKIYNLHKDA